MNEEIKTERNIDGTIRCGNSSTDVDPDRIAVMLWKEDGEPEGGVQPYMRKAQGLFADLQSGDQKRVDAACNRIGQLPVLPEEDVVRKNVYGRRESVYATHGYRTTTTGWIVAAVLVVLAVAAVLFFVYAR